MKLKPGDIRRVLTARTPEYPAVLVFGPNRTAVQEAGAALLRQAIGPEPDQLALTQLGEEELRGDHARLADELAAQSLLGGPRAVRLRVQGDAAAEPVLAVVKALEAGGSAAAFLVIEGGDLGARSKIRLAFEAAKRLAAIPCYADEDGDLAKLALSMLREAGVSLDEAAQARLEAMLPGDRGVLRRTVETVILMAGPEMTAPGEAELAALLADDDEAAVNSAVRGALAGDGPASARALSDLGGFSGISALRALERALLRLIEVRRLCAVERLAPAAAMQRLKPPVFWGERAHFESALRRWDDPQLARALDLLWNAQHRIMRGKGPEELVAAHTFRVIANLAA